MGFRGIMGEFTMQHLSSGELEAYLKNKQFNGIIFFGYTNGGTGAGARYSAYYARPDVYEHHRWILRKIIPISRAVQRARRQKDPAARLSSTEMVDNASTETSLTINLAAEGKIKEMKSPEEGLNRITGRSKDTAPTIIRFGNNISRGIYLFVDSDRPEEVIVNADKISLPNDAVVFNEFSEKILEVKPLKVLFLLRRQKDPL